jgi:hypothetical protein
MNARNLNLIPEALARYAAPNANFVLVVGPHNGLGRAERAKKDTANQARALPGYQGQSP